MENLRVRASRITMIVLAVATGLYSLRFWAVPAHIWLGIDDGIRGVIQHVPLQALTHMIVAPIALLTGPFQFIPGLRARHLRLHRWTGRVYATACLVAGIAALATAPFASGGPVAGLGFGLLAVCWIIATGMGWYTALARQFGQHRIWMRFSYAMTFGAVTLRLQIPIGFILGFHSYSQMSVWLAYTSWIPNVVIVALYTALQKPRARGF
jgi:Predicted membrane protein (DUF2306)